MFSTGVNSVILEGLTIEELKQVISEEVRREIGNIKQSFKPVEPSDYLTRKEVAEMFKVDISTVHNWTAKNIITAYGMNGSSRRVFYKRAEVESAVTKIKK